MFGWTSENVLLSVRLLGDSGHYISKIILGTASFGSSKWQEWVLEEEAVLPLLEHAFKMEINTWDAIFYALDPIHQTPISANMDPLSPTLINPVGLSRKHILDAVSASCARLGIYIDVLQIHRLDHQTPPEEIMRALNDVVESGQVRYIGAKHGWHKFISMQPYYNLLYREEEREMIPYCKDSGVGIISWKRGIKREMADNMPKNVEGGKGGEVDEGIVGRVKEVARRCGVNMAVVGLAWYLKKGLSDEDLAYVEELYAQKEVAI
ncbi:Aldo/keto reductase [Acephala macrosclerotiorum]|nr:Aldo/keto reductase [Acephala macrosclerotiorum]